MAEIAAFCGFTSTTLKQPDLPRRRSLHRTPFAVTGALTPCAAVGRSAGGASSAEDAGGGEERGEHGNDQCDDGQDAVGPVGLGDVLGGG